MGTSAEDPEEKSSVALLSPACLLFYDSLSQCIYNYYAFIGELVVLNIA